MNNRQLKFRIWDTNKNQWLKQNDWIGINNYGIVYDDGNHDYPDLSLRNSCIIQQSTGLTDKNGKKIYEGDILKYDISNYTTLIVWSEEDSAFITKSKDGGGFINFTRMSVYEVIGNICETPELLKN